MIDDFIAACRPKWNENGMNEHDFSDTFFVPWELIVEQEDTFEIDKRGRRGHRDGAFDDVLFALFIAWQLHLRCPRGLRPGAPGLVLSPQSAADLNRPGARDWGIRETPDTRKQLETV